MWRMRNLKLLTEVQKKHVVANVASAAAAVAAVFVKSIFHACF